MLCIERLAGTYCSALSAWHILGVSMRASANDAKYLQRTTRSGSELPALTKQDTSADSTAPYYHMEMDRRSKDHVDQSRRPARTRTGGWTADGRTCRTSSATAMSSTSAAGPSSSSTPLAPSGREAPESDGYRAIFGKDKKPIPRWVPIALVSICAAVPAFLIDLRTLLL